MQGVTVWLQYTTVCLSCAHLLCTYMLPLKSLIHILCTMIFIDLQFIGNVSFIATFYSKQG